jgi:hypothetical protein
MYFTDLSFLYFSEQSLKLDGRLVVKWSTFYGTRRHELDCRGPGADSAANVAHI